MRFSSFNTVSIPPLYVLVRALLFSTQVALYAVRKVASMEIVMAVEVEEEESCFRHALPLDRSAADAAQPAREHLRHD